EEFKFESRLSLITLGVRDLRRSAEFYESLGWTRSSVGGDEVAFFALGGLVLAIWGREHLAEDAGVPAQGDGFRGVALAYNVRERLDVDRALAAVEKRGGRITRPASDASWGGRTGYFTDVDGHLWEVAWNPGFPMDAEGRIQLPP